MENLESVKKAGYVGVKKGYIINDEFVENENGNFYAFETADALNEFFDNLPTKTK